MSELITPELVTLDQDLGGTRESVIRHLAEQVVAAGRASSLEELFADAIAREQKTATGVPGGIAIPHCRSAAVTQASLAMARLTPPVDWGAKDGPADIVFFIAAPEGADQEHLQLLAKLARSLIKKDFTGALRSAPTPQAVVELVDGALGLGPAQEAPQAPATGAADGGQASAGTSGSGAGGPAAGAAAGAAAAGGPTGAHAESTSGTGEVHGGGGTATSGDAPASASGSRPERLVAVTACPPESPTPTWPRIHSQRPPLSAA